MRKRPLFWVALVAASFVLGCAGWPHGGEPTPKPHPVPPPLIHVDAALGMFILMSVLAFAVAVALFFTLPTAHRLSLTLGIFSVAVFGVSVLVKITLPFIAYGLIGLALLSVAAVAYEVGYKIKHGSFDRPGDGVGNL
jgi:hypothetical protein